MAHRVLLIFTIVPRRKIALMLVVVPIEGEAPFGFVLPKLFGEAFLPSRLYHESPTIQSSHSRQKKSSGSGK